MIDTDPKKQIKIERNKVGQIQRKKQSNTETDWCESKERNSLI